MPTLNWIKLPGLTSYQQGIELMQNALQAICTQHTAERIFLLEHADIYTAGTSANSHEILNPTIEVLPTGRGGKITYHGPGQRVIYPILNLTNPQHAQDLRRYIHNLEQIIINCLQYWHINGQRNPGNIGVWVQDQDKLAKIAAIGIRVRKWVSYHGIAININNDLSKFDHIIPCGLQGSAVTSLEKLGVNIDLDEFDKVFQQEFLKVFYEYY